MAVHITCRKPGFRRAGLAHPAQATYPNETFTATQLKALMAEPMLQVEILADEPEQPGAAEESPVVQAAEISAEVKPPAPVADEPPATKVKAPKAKGKK
jgi:hypothetical protein